MEELGKLVRLRKVSVIEEQIVHVEFEDGREKQVDLRPLMHGPIFDELLADGELFNQVAVQRGTLVWPNGADIDPDVLYYGLTPAKLVESHV